MPPDAPRMLAVIGALAACNDSEKDGDDARRRVDRVPVALRRLAFSVAVGDNHADGTGKAGSMAEITSGHVVSDLPDLTGVALADLPAMSVPHEDAVLERITDNPNTEHTDQNAMPV